MEKKAVLIIEDDASGRQLAAYNLEKAGYTVDAASNGEEGLALFAPDRHALVITDIRMPGKSGMEVLREVRERSPETPVIVITAYGNVELAVQAMKLGAVDFAPKPFNREHLLLLVRRALENTALRSEVRQLRADSRGLARPIVHDSAVMQKVLSLADRVAKSDATALVTGESGTGKELVARRIHLHSARADGPFVVAHTAAMPAELLESELFGHVKGAFTGAERDRKGRFRAAEGGTLFLDEIGDLPLPLQAKLLRVLQEKTVEVVGDDRPRAVDARVVAATNRNLRQMVESGEFREDLFYRLNVVEIEIPPLRERREDIEPLIRHFVEAFAEGRVPEVPSDVLESLISRDYPGNVRELENTCQRLVVLCGGDALTLDDLPSRAGGQMGAASSEWPPLPADGLALFDLERRVIERALEMTEGNVSKAARYLSIPRHVLAYRMEKYGI